MGRECLERPPGLLKSTLQVPLASVLPSSACSIQGCVTHMAPPLQVYLVHVDKEEDEQDQLCQEDDQQHDEKLER